MKAVITVVGKDRPGILAFVSGKCASVSINIVDVTQKVLQDLFTMIMIVEIPENLRVPDVASAFQKDGQKEGLQIQVMQEDIFNAMHTI